MYNTGNSADLTSEKAFGVLIWSGAASKTATLEFAEYTVEGATVTLKTDGIKQTYIIDYSAVTFAGSGGGG